MILMEQQTLYNNFSIECTMKMPSGHQHVNAVMKQALGALSMFLFVFAYSKLLYSAEAEQLPLGHIIYIC